jgi:hypothetical protein
MKHYEINGNTYQLDDAVYDHLMDALCNVNAFKNKAARLSRDNQQLMAQISAKAEQPKPLLADAKVGDLCQRRDGGYVTILKTNGYRQFPVMCDDLMTRTLDGKICSGHPEYDIVSTEPLAPIGSAEWALQMMKLGKDVCRKGHETAYYHICNDGKEIACSLKNESRLTYGHLLVRKWGETGNDWQLYEPKQEPCPACNGTGKVEKPEPKFKVGDLVTDGVINGNITSLTDDLAWVKTGLYEYRMSLCNLTPISPSEVVIHIGCLSGTVRSRDSKSFHLLRKGKNTMVIYFDALDTPTRKLVRELIEKQQGDAK